MRFVPKSSCISSEKQTQKSCPRKSYGVDALEMFLTCAHCSHRVEETFPERKDLDTLDGHKRYEIRSLKTWTFLSQGYR